MAENTEALTAALVQVGSYQPLIHAATGENFRNMCEIAKKHSCPLAIKAHGLEDLITLAKKCLAENVKKLVLDLCPQSLGDYIITFRRLYGNLPLRGLSRTLDIRYLLMPPILPCRMLQLLLELLNMPR